MKCVNCGSEKEAHADGNYIGYMKCAECGFLKAKAAPKPNVILPDDPMDLLACESCQ